MALTKCIECGAEISTDAKVCPSCGTSKPHKTNYKKMLIIGGVVLVLFTMWDISKRGSSATNTDLSQPTSQGEQPIFNKLESAVYSALLYEDLCSLVDGGESMIASKGIVTPLPIIVSSKKLQSEYEKNEVSADQKFKGKLVSISGDVVSVDKALADSIMIGLKGGSNPFIYPRAIIESGYENWAGSLNKGDNVGLICTVNGMTVGSASLGQCIPAYDWANNTTNSIINSTKEGIENNNEFFIKMVKATKDISAKLKDDSKCLSENSHKECMKEINSALK